MKYTIFDENGEHFANLDCAVEDAHLQAQEGQRLVVGEFDGSHYFDGMEVLKKTTKPSEYHTWDALNDVWVVDLDAVRTSMWEKIKGRRNGLIRDGGYKVGEHWFHSDPTSIAQQQGLIIAAMSMKAAGASNDTPITPTPWKTMSGAFVPMTVGLAASLLPAGMAQQGAIFSKAEYHKAWLDQVDQPWTYDFSEGWPEIFNS